MMVHLYMNWGIGPTSEEKDVGVTVDSNLEFDKYAYFKVSKQIALWP